MEEYSPELIYVPGKTNIVADALSRLNLDNQEPESNNPLIQNAIQAGTEHLHSLSEVPEDSFPLTYKLIASEQQKDKDLLCQLKNNPSYIVKKFHGGGKTRALITLNDKIVLPTSLQERAVNWYHTTLCHPGETRTEQTLRQHFVFKNLRKLVHQICSKCDTCQRTKKNKKIMDSYRPKRQRQTHEKHCASTSLDHILSNNLKIKKKKI